jgi:hypothetical protein
MTDNARDMAASSGGVPRLRETGPRDQPVVYLRAFTASSVVRTAFAKKPKLMTAAL